MKGNMKGNRKKYGKKNVKGNRGKIREKYGENRRKTLCAVHPV